MVKKAKAGKRVVAAAGVATVGGDKGLARVIEAAMSEAIQKAAAEGVTDPDAVRAKMLEARARARAAYFVKQAEAAEDARARE